MCLRDNPCLRWTRKNPKRNLPMSTTSMPETNPRTGRFSPLAWMGIVVGILLAIVKALIWSKGVLNAEVFGYALAGAVVPGRNRIRHSGSSESAKLKPICALVPFALCLFSFA